jgi:hypothetical protein
VGMKLGLYGWDRQVAAVVRAAFDEGGTVSVACHVPAAAGLSAVRAGDDSWQALIDDRSCDAIVVGTDAWDEERIEGLRHLVQAGRPLLLGHPITLSMLLAYEVDMIRGDTGGVVLPFLPDRRHPLVARLVQAVEGGLVGTGRLGKLESIGLVRRIPDRTKQDVLSWLARDADIVRLLVGEPQRLSTLASLPSEAAYTSLTVEFGGESQVPARWQVARGEEPGAELTLIGDSGQIRVTMPESTVGPVVWTWHDSEGVEEAAPFDGAATMLEILRRSLAQREVPASTGRSIDNPAVPLASWPDAARAIELAETVPRSLARGRAIDLHQEEFSELGTFKGTMASLGCGLVIVGLLVLVFATVIGGIAHEAGWEFGEQLMSVWPIVVLAVLGGFLALQLLPLLIEGPSRK